MFYNWLNNLPKDLAKVLEKKRIKKIGFQGQKAQSVGFMANRLNWLRNQSTDCAHLVDDRLREAKKFLSLPVAFSSQLRRFSYRSRFDWGNGNLSCIKCSNG